MKRCTIIGSGPFDPTGFVPPSEGDYLICADGGYRTARKLGLSPDLLIGDFDSMDGFPEDAACEVIRLKPEKDDTDLMSAAKTALQRGYTSFRIYGGLGGRLDHTVANFQLLAYLLDHQASGTLLDGDTTVTMLEKTTVSFSRTEGYLSLFSYTPTCTVSARGVKYPLECAVLSAGFPLGVSNEIVAETAEIEVLQGKLLVIVTR